MTGVISPTNDRLFEVIMNGPKDSLYEGGKFKILVFLPENFPIVPPKLKFMTKIYHPNIDFFGRICLDKLKQTQGGWAPIINIPSLLISLQSLLSSPNHEDPLNSKVAKLYNQKGSKEFERTAREYTEIYAK